MSSQDRRQNEINYRRQLFEEKFVRKGPQDCWLWTAAKLKEGHGLFGMGDLSPVKPAYVAAWFFYRNNEFDLSAQFLFKHLCGNPSCVNPAHLIIFGEEGLENDSTVLAFIAHRHPKIRKALTELIRKL
jgi:hypothetical protein